MVKELFVAVKIIHPEMQDNRCRSVYGMDVMIDKGTFTPRLLEMTFAPDCQRACKYHPTFFTDIMRGLFLNDAQSLNNFDKLF